MSEKKIKVGDIIPIKGYSACIVDIISQEEGEEEILLVEYCYFDSIGKKERDYVRQCGNRCKKLCFERISPDQISSKLKEKHFIKNNVSANEIKNERDNDNEKHHENGNENEPEDENERKTSIGSDENVILYPKNPPSFGRRNKKPHAVEELEFEREVEITQDTNKQQTHNKLASFSNMSDLSMSNIYQDSSYVDSPKRSPTKGSPKKSPTKGTLEYIFEPEECDFDALQQWLEDEFFVIGDLSCTSDDYFKKYSFPQKLSQIQKKLKAKSYYSNSTHIREMVFRDIIILLIQLNIEGKIDPFVFDYLVEILFKKMLVISEKYKPLDPTIIFSVIEKTAVFQGTSSSPVCLSSLSPSASCIMSIGKHLKKLKSQYKEQKNLHMSGFDHQLHLEKQGQPRSRKGRDFLHRTDFNINSTSARDASYLPTSYNFTPTPQKRESGSPKKESQRLPHGSQILIPPLNVVGKVEGIEEKLSEKAGRRGEKQEARVAKAKEGKVKPSAPDVLSTNGDQGESLGTVQQATVQPTPSLYRYKKQITDIDKGATSETIRARGVLSDSSKDSLGHSRTKSFSNILSNIQNMNRHLYTQTPFGAVCLDCKRTIRQDSDHYLVCFNCKRLSCHDCIKIPKTLISGIKAWKCDQCDL